MVRPYRLDYRPLIDRDLTDKAIDFMERKAKGEQPFFVYLPYTATHFPTMPHPDYDGKTGNGAWADLLTQIDDYLGELDDKIESLGISENTILIFTADNGTHRTIQSKTAKGVVKGAKGERSRPARFSPGTQSLHPDVPAGSRVAFGSSDGAPQLFGEVSSPGSRRSSNPVPR